METVQLTRTANREFHLLGAGGQLAIRAYDQLSQYLRRRLSGAHAALLAEPNFDPERGSIDWYAAALGPAARLVELAPAARAAAEARLAALVEEVGQEAERLRGSTAEGERLIGEMLGLALEIPGLDYVYVVGGQPVLVAWGHVAAGTAGPAGVLTRRVAQARTVPEVAAPGPLVLAAALRRSGCVPAALALLAAVVLMALGLWLTRDRLRAELALSAPACRVPAGQLALLDQLAGEAAREQALRQQLAQATEAVARARLACPALPAPRAQPKPAARAPRQTPLPVPAAKAPSPALDRDQQRVKDQGGKSGRVQITLAWDDRNDLDLIVACPDGGVIYFANRQDCGGTLDIDANVDDPGRTDPVENVVWSDKPMAGTYVVRVRYNGRVRAAPVSEFRVTLHQDGQPDRHATGRVAVGRIASVLEFTVD